MQPSSTSYVLELSHQLCCLIGQLVHMRLMDNPEDEVAQELFKQMRLQTTSVYKSPQAHKVFRSPLDIPPDAKNIHKTETLYYLT